MAGRVAGKVAVVMGGGQTPGATVGNGRAAAIVLGREGARVAVVDRDLASAEETVRMIRAEQGEAIALQADATREADVQRVIGGERCQLLHRSRLTVQMDGNDHPRPGTDPGLHGRGIDQQERRIAVHEHDARPGAHHGERRGDERVGRHDHLVAAPDVERA